MKYNKVTLQQLITSVNALPLEQDLYPVWKVYAINETNPDYVFGYVSVGHTKEVAKASFARRHPECPIIVAMGRRNHHTPLRKPGRPNPRFDE